MHIGVRRALLASVAIPLWVAAAAAFHIKPADGLSWINGQARTSWANLMAAPTSATFSRASVQYARNSAGMFTAFSSGNAAITDRGLLYEPSETTVSNYTMRPLSWGGGTNVSRTTGQPDTFGGSTAVLYTANGTAAVAHYATAGSATVVNTTSYITQAIVSGLSGGFVQLACPSAAFGSNAWGNFDLTDAGTPGTMGSAVTEYGIERLSVGKYRIWIKAPATASSSGTPIIAFIPLINSTRLATSSSTATMVIHACMVSASSKPGSPIDNTTSAATRAACALPLFPPAGTYTVTFKYGDGTADQTFAGVVVTGSGYTPDPTTLNGRYIVDIIGVRT
ncbi:hypothetical protein ABI_15490 [Asticcacaulis biprosthecium C19]|uniref:Uncharacterized protein n=1 Tax=Asticcacaulis biprosthecium C19 TaxID=715226 RepID=F4QJC6_9CAUL|nr:hypothetical protein [Asticcacaulis biprosthecium]EGF93109.1 hypothetical protein ABI_15490 [Asticcacaulis biprosthecium C19]